MLTKKILSIETSCDETAAAVLEYQANKSWPIIKTLSSVVKSQIQIHRSFGGVVPEAAARAHVKNIRPVTEKALLDAKLTLKAIDYLAVTTGPGLIPSLIVGVEFAKGLALASNKPVIEVNHMAGHLYSPLGQNKNAKDLFPMISLIVSGGHTILVLMKSAKDFKVLGQTQDDAVGEAFDKVAKLLNLPYPGGPEVSALAEQAQPDFEFPRPMINSKDYNFSFSGLKTAVLYHVQKLVAKPSMLTPKQKADICKAFEDAAVDVLVTKTFRAASSFKAKSISLSGGVAANKALRLALSIKAKTIKLNFFVPDRKLCTDNAEMIGIAAGFMLHNGYKPKIYQDIKPDSNLQL